MFPSHIDSLDSLRYNDMIKFKREGVRFNGEDFIFTIVSYMVADADFWKNPYTRECRGIVFDKYGNCVSAPFQKFFNVNEREETQVHNLPGGPVIIMDKRDGSMIQPVLVSTQGKSHVFFKTKKSFYSDVALDANRNANDNVIALSSYLLKTDWTPIFEYTSPNSKIVIDYGDTPQFVLLAVRNNFDGSYMNWDDVVGLAKRFSVKPIDVITDMSLDDILDHGRNVEGVEGWVIWWPESNVRVKLKTEWYLKRHHAVTELRMRDVAEMVLDEKIDDLKSFLFSIGKEVDRVEAIEREVTQALAGYRSQVEAIVEKFKHLSVKDFAVKFNGHALFSLLMQQFKGQEPNYKQYWKKHELRRYPIDTIYDFSHASTRLEVMAK
jgi:T4 RnlA family RNA ligase